MWPGIGGPVLVPTRKRRSPGPKAQNYPAAPKTSKATPRKAALIAKLAGRLAR
jgi:hypothetical protein